MNISPFFRNLRSAYQAELDDLTQDSEGKDVLRRRLADKRKEMGFLVQMMGISPEMVAVVFHQAFRFTAPPVLERLLTLDEAEFPDWADLAQAITLEPWAQSLAQVVLRDPLGEWFMAVAVGLEYLQHHPRWGQAHSASNEYDDADAEATDSDDGDDDNAHPLSADDATDRQDDQSREDASADWLADQGFERKD